jgi:predicted permease
MKTYLSHFIFAFRIMGKTPGVTVLSIAVLSVSLALVSLMFNMYESIIYASLPYERSEDLMLVNRVNPENPNGDISIPFQSFKELSTQQKSFDGVIGVFSDTVNLQSPAKTGQIQGTYISPTFTETLGTPPVMGRGFVEADALPEADPVVLISDKVWKDYFAAAGNVVGQTFEVDGVVRTVIGVMPESFDFPFVNLLWIPLNTDTLHASTGWGASVLMLGRIKEGLSHEAAALELNEAFLRVKESLPVENERFQTLRVREFRELFVNDETIMLFNAMGLCSLLVLFMGCSIVSNLVTVRSARRSSELAIRSALGASRSDIVFQMLFESMICSSLAMVFGWLLMEWFSLSVLAPIFEQFNAPSWLMSSDYSLRQVVFVGVTLVSVSLLSTLIPALRASRTSLNDLLKDSSRTGSSLRLSILGRLLIIFQIAAACAVVTGGGIIAYFLHDIRNQEFSFSPDSYLFASVGMDNNTHGEPAQRVELMRNIRRELESISEVQAMTYSSELIAGGLSSSLRVVGQSYGAEDTWPRFYRRVVAPGYFEVMNIALLSGRGFEETDDVDHPKVAVITDVVAKQLFGEENPIGKQVLHTNDTEEAYTIVGVCGDVFRSDRDREKRSGFFLSAYQEVWMDMGLQIRLPGDPTAFEPTLVRVVSGVDSRAVVSNVATMRVSMERGLVGLKVVFVVFVSFAVGALIMAGAGLYGVVSFAVNQRVRELGIRLALGASPCRVVGMVFRQGMVNVGLGMGLGLIAAYGLRHVLSMVLNPLYEQLWVYLAVIAGVMTVACASILIPAVRAGVTDPADALRSE